MENVKDASKEKEAKRLRLPTKPTLVEIRPIETMKWHGKTGAESFTRPKKIHALVDSVTTKYATGLTDEDIKSLQEEKNVKYDLSDMFIRDTPHPFWDSPMATLSLENSTMIIDIMQPLNYIKFKIAKASRFVANSIAEYNEGLWPDATHVIYDEKEQVDAVASKVEMKTEAIIEASKLTPDRKIQAILILGEKDVKNQSPSFITVELDKVITKDPEAFLRLIKMDANETAMHALVLEALGGHVLRREGHRIMYMDSFLGNDVLEVARYLADDNNQDMKMILLSKLNK